MTVRERWFGSTGRKVPAVALEGAIDILGAIELNGINDVSTLEAAHAAGIPVVIHANSLAGVAAALARPEVSCVLVTDEALLSVDLADHTYG